MVDISPAAGGGEIQFWRTSDWTLQFLYDQELGYEGFGVRSLAFSADGDKFAYGRWDALVAVATNPLNSKSVVSSRKRIFLGRILTINRPHVGLGVPSSAQLTLSNVTAPEEARLNFFAIRANTTDLSIQHRRGSVGRGGLFRRHANGVMFGVEKCDHVVHRPGTRPALLVRRRLDQLLVIRRFVRFSDARFFEKCAPGRFNSLFFRLSKVPR